MLAKSSLTTVEFSINKTASAYNFLPHEWKSRHAFSGRIIAFLNNINVVLREKCYIITDERLHYYVRYPEKIIILR